MFENVTLRYRRHGTQQRKSRAHASSSSPSQREGSPAAVGDDQSPSREPAPAARRQPGNRRTHGGQAAGQSSRRGALASLEQALTHAERVEAVLGEEEHHLREPSVWLAMMGTANKKLHQYSTLPPQPGHLSRAITIRGSLHLAYLCSQFIPLKGAHTLLTCVTGTLHPREPISYLPVFPAHSTRGSPSATYLCSQLTPPEGAHQLLTCVPSSLHQREPISCLPVFPAHSTRGSPSAAYLCSQLTPPEGAQQLLTCVPAHSTRGSPTATYLCSWLTPRGDDILHCLPVLPDPDVLQAEPVAA
ncbi:UNVERIFIED_CONTAM: hypothetical protein FKN15_028494 [Acipenser sinensis]